jgi:hypothetical protein
MDIPVIDPPLTPNPDLPGGFFDFPSWLLNFFKELEFSCGGL